MRRRCGRRASRCCGRHESVRMRTVGMGSVGAVMCRDTRGLLIDCVLQVSRRRPRRAPASVAGCLSQEEERVQDIRPTLLSGQESAGSKGKECIAEVFAGILEMVSPTSVLYDRIAPTARSQRRRGGIGQGGSLTGWDGMVTILARSSLVMEGSGVAPRGITMCGLYVCGD